MSRLNRIDCRNWLSCFFPQKNHSFPAPKTSSEVPINVRPGQTKSKSKPARQGIWLAMQSPEWIHPIKRARERLKPVQGWAQVKNRSLILILDNCHATKGVRVPAIHIIKADPISWVTVPASLPMKKYHALANDVVEKNQRHGRIPSQVLESNGLTSISIKPAILQLENMTAPVQIYSHELAGSGCYHRWKCQFFTGHSNH